MTTNISYKDTNNFAAIINLNGLADQARLVSSTIDNSSNLDLFADFELTVKYNSLPAINGVLNIYVIPIIGSITPTGGTGSTIPQNSTYAGFFHSKSPSTSIAERLILTRISIPPNTFKIAVYNTSGTIFSSTGCSLGMRTYKLQIA
jgi:hypothetical protein